MPAGVLAQTDGAELPAVEVPGWDLERALDALRIDKIPFDLIDGNTLGMARGRTIAINPVNPHPDKTRFHEVGHILLGHTGQTDQTDTEHLSHSLREVEAESVALLCCGALGLPGAEFARGYIQHYNQGEPIPERSAQRIFKIADQIIRAGQTEGARP